LDGRQGAGGAVPHRLAQLGQRHPFATSKKGGQERGKSGSIEVEGERGSHVEFEVDFGVNLHAEGKNMGECFVHSEHPRRFGRVVGQKLAFVVERTIVAERFLLLLTTTPVENRLRDLYEMISLVAPGLLGTPAQFRTRYATSGGDIANPRNLDDLRAKTRQVMVRHRRSEVALRLPQRLAETVLVPPDDDERDLYADVVERIRIEAKEASPARRLTLRSVSRLAGSTPAAAAPALAKLGWTDLAARAEAVIDPAKIRLLVRKLGEYTGRGEKVLVFTAFRKTLETVAESVRAAGIDAAVYDGGLSRAEKERVIGTFRDLVAARDTYLRDRLEVDALVGDERE
jgi:hypothetical protein